jgi:hypothetical protein
MIAILPIDLTNSIVYNLPCASMYSLTSLFLAFVASVSRVISQYLQKKDQKEENCVQKADLSESLNYRQSIVMRQSFALSHLNLHL